MALNPLKEEHLHSKGFLHSNIYLGHNYSIISHSGGPSPLSLTTQLQTGQMCQRKPGATVEAWCVFLEREIYSKIDTEWWGTRGAGEIIFLQKQDGYIMRSQQETSFHKLKMRLQGHLTLQAGSFVLPLRPKGKSQEYQSQTTGKWKRGNTHETHNLDFHRAQVPLSRSLFLISAPISLPLNKLGSTNV